MLLNSFFFINSYGELKRNSVILDLKSGQGYSTEIIYKPGQYRVEIAGLPGAADYDDGRNSFTQVIEIDKPFYIMASCSAPDFALSNLGIVSKSGTIFGGKGGFSAGVSISGVQSKQILQGSLTTGGSACHFVPVGGVFGSDYLRCFHCGAPASGVYGGAGAYGGGAGGRGAKTRNGSTGSFTDRTGQEGISGAGGSGGTGGTGTKDGNAGAGNNGNPGSSGVGIGAGTSTMGGVAYFDGKNWIQPARGKNTTGDAFIKITYLGS